MNFLKSVIGTKGEKTVLPQPSSRERQEISDLIKELLTLPNKKPYVGTEDWEGTIDRVNEERAERRNEIAEKLANFGAVAVEPLVSLLEALDKDSVFRAAASRALMKIGEPAVDSLVELLNAYAKHHADSDKGYDIIAPLTVYGDVRTTDALISIMKRARIFNDKEEAVKALGMVAKKNHNEKAIKALFYALTDESIHSDDLQKVAAEALGTIGTPSIEISLLRILNDYINKHGYLLKTEWYGGQNSIIHVITALGLIKSSQSVEVLIRLLQKYPKNDYVISALGNIGDARAKEALEKLDTKI